MKFIFVVCSLLVFINSAVAQNGMAVYAEGGGPGIFSFNLDTRLSHKNDGVGVRAGVGFYRHDFRKKFYNAVNLPLGISFLQSRGSGRKNFIEFGAGVTPVFASDSVANENLATTFGHILVGYRLQPQRNGFSLRIFFSPVFGKFGFIPYYGGISMGYKFRWGKKKSEPAVK